MRPFVQTYHCSMLDPGTSGWRGGGVRACYSKPETFYQHMYIDTLVKKGKVGAQSIGHAVVLNTPAHRAVSLHHFGAILVHHWARRLA